jgi:hypothetical protein
MSERRQARLQRSGVLAAGRAPLELRAGVCIEVWDDGHGSEMVGGTRWPPAHFRARARWREARDAWLKAHGVHSHWEPKRVPPELRVSTTPWSFYYILETHPPGNLARRLAKHGLPADWKPRLVKSWDYGPSLLPDEAKAWAGFKACRDRHSATT